MRRLRARLDRLESHAHQTMSGAEELTALVADLVNDLVDGININLEIAGKRIPVTLRIDPREEPAT